MRIGSKFSVFALASVLALTGCSVPEPAPTVTPSATVTEEPAPEPVFVAAPLTGVLYEESQAAHLALPAVSAKIDNTFNGRPQLALNDADVVYMTRVEGGMTRLLPVWHSRMPETIGPVRSVRPVDAAVIHPYGGIFVYSGGQAPFKSAAKKTGLVMSDEDTENKKGTYFREKSRKAPWNLFFSPLKLQQAYLDQAAPKPGFEFAEVSSAKAAGTTSPGLTVKYPGTTSTWEVGEVGFHWAATAEIGYLHTLDKSAHTQDGGDRVVTKNVVVIEVEHDNSFRDPRYGAIPKAKLENNSGVAHVFSDGFYLKGTWRKAGSADPILLFTESGESLKLAIGNTWVEMQDVAKSKLTIQFPKSE